MTKQMLLFSSLFIFSAVWSMENPLEDQKDKDSNKNARRTYMVYSHGFGEGEDSHQAGSFISLGQEWSMPLYPDAPGQIPKAVFYTKPAVHTLVNHLHAIATKDDCESIRLVGLSTGAGTAINCLSKLANYDKNKEYFEGSLIHSKEDADTIMQKINNGAFVATAPFLHIRKANGIAIPSKILAGATVAGLTAGACYFGPSLCKDSIDPQIARWGFVAAGIAAYYAFGDWVKKLYGNGIVRFIVPYVTNKHFDPHHETPLQSVEQLRGKLTCPTLLHFNEQDRVLENPDEDTIKVYDALKNDNTHIIITNDGWHNGPSAQFYVHLNKFNKKYLKKDEGIDISATQPSVEDLRKEIYASQTFMGNNAPYLGGVAIIGAPVALVATYKKLRE